MKIFESSLHQRLASLTEYLFYKDKGHRTWSGFSVSTDSMRSQRHPTLLRVVLETSDMDLLELSLCLNGASFTRFQETPAYDLSTFPYQDAEVWWYRFSYEEDEDGSYPRHVSLQRPTGLDECPQEAKQHCSFPSDMLSIKPRRGGYGSTSSGNAFSRDPYPRLNGLINGLG